MVARHATTASPYLRKWTSRCGCRPSETGDPSHSRSDPGSGSVAARSPPAQATITLPNQVVTPVIGPSNSRSGLLAATAPAAGGVTQEVRGYDPGPRFTG